MTQRFDLASIMRRRKFECKAITDIDAVVSLIFASRDWIEAMNRLGFTLLFYGIDLVNLVDHTNKGSLGSTAEPAYIALGLIENKGAKPLSQNHYSEGYPYLKLLLRCVQPWSWSSEGRHTLHIKSLNLDLNISIYSHFRGYRVANHRLVAGDDGDKLESAVCCGNADLASAFSVEMRSTPAVVSAFSVEMRSTPAVVFGATIEGREDFCVFRLSTETCSCELEQKLEGVSPADDTTKQDFKEVEARYSQVLFSGEEAKWRGAFFPTIPKPLPDNGEDVDVGRLARYFTLLPFEIQTQILDSLDESTSRDLLYHYTYWALTFGYSYPKIFMHARGRHTFTWAAVIRQNSDYELLRERGGRPFLAGQGVKSLYDADSEVSNKLHTVLLCFRPTSFAASPDKWDRGVTTLLQPFIRLHCRKLGELRYRTPILVNNLDDYIEYRDEELVIPILYLKSTHYRLEYVKLHFRYSAVEGNYLYSFKTRHGIVTLAEGGTNKIPWHERSPEICENSDDAYEGEDYYAVT
ncbi:hypothetical protein NQ176_g830 [Zarea fungicola]|uniref:Uncharacterized protein n=1 Tax=Zarea fungicola TaxID=93591 RepID=A0ACC1NWR7_9HYPO|nr:hypothetical protein NQ176_g830 [Lecanicillium fungicola]